MIESMQQLVKRLQEQLAGLSKRLNEAEVKHLADLEAAKTMLGLDKLNRHLTKLDAELAQALRLPTEKA